MSQKFRFNVNRLEFEKVTRPVWYFLLKGVKYFLVTVSLAVCYYIVFALVVDTDTEKRIKQENEAYSTMYEGMLERERLLENVIEGMKTKEDGIYRPLFRTLRSPVSMSFSPATETSPTRISSATSTTVSTLWSARPAGWKEIFRR